MSYFNQFKVLNINSFLSNQVKYLFSRISYFFLPYKKISMYGSENETEFMDSA